MTRVILVGGGGREHALAWRLKRDDPSLDIIAAPGNPGIASLARCVAVSATDIDNLVALAQSERADAVFVGPEAPLGAGLVDRLDAVRVPAFGPSAAGAMLETSKSFAKDVMREAGVPTAHATTHSDAASAKRAAHALGAPVVIKATGLAAGKGVVVCETLAEAERTIDEFIDRRTLGDAGAEVLVEEFMSGEELSVFMLTDGTGGIMLVPAQDHKRLNEGDTGPNTGGMGAYAPVSLATNPLTQTVMRTVMLPTLAAMNARGTPFRGLLYAGLMLTDAGPKVVEFNCRFGDPETQAVLPVTRGSLLESMLAIARREGLGATTLTWSGKFAVTTVVAAAGYPGKVRSGDAIALPDSSSDVLVFHAGTALNGGGTLASAGGRVLAITSVADTFEQAQQGSRDAAAAVQLAGKQFRRDIGWREASRRRDPGGARGA
ncbi:MAG TPA: phosphoribosylamine--glycine ligase [Gemmatimonadaceae bacterium]|nr:phosphoribosylamine--glycine ligase [Gemmatimonadaceae bacterium]